MKFAKVNNKLVEAFPKGKGFCPCCNGNVIAYCGNKKIPHWKHSSLGDCDYWWENETQWHREWKNYWLKSEQEIVQFDRSTNEKHIADVKNEKGIVIEFQNSPMSEFERLSREKFYGDMIWIVNARKFKHSINIGCKLPDPFHSKVKNLNIRGVGTPPTAFLFYDTSVDLSDIPMLSPSTEAHMDKLINETHIGHYLFSWKNKRSVWLSATKPVFFDFGDDTLWNLGRYNNHSGLCLKSFTKQYIITHYGGRA